MRPRTRRDPASAARRPTAPGAGSAILAIGLVLLALGLSDCEPQGAGGPEGPPTSPRQQIGKVLGGGWAALDLPDTSGADSTWAWVKAFYARRSDRPLWSGRSPHREARALVETLQRLD